MLHPIFERCMNRDGLAVELENHVRPHGACVSTAGLQALISLVHAAPSTTHHDVHGMTSGLVNDRHIEQLSCMLRFGMSSCMLTATKKGY